MLNLPPPQTHTSQPRFINLESCFQHAEAFCTINQVITAGPGAAEHARAISSQQEEGLLETEGLDTRPWSFSGRGAVWWQL